MAFWTGERFQAEVEGSEVEVLVVIGALEPGASPERIDGTLLKSFPNLGLVQMQNVGLYPMLEAPQELSSIIWRDGRVPRR